MQLILRNLRKLAIQLKILPQELNILSREHLQFIFQLIQLDECHIGLLQTSIGVLKFENNILSRWRDYIKVVHNCIAYVIEEGEACCEEASDIAEDELEGV